MQYVGGKQKSGGSQIAKVIAQTAVTQGIDSYVEPFCGGLSVTSRVTIKKRTASDACLPLITLYRAIQQGWVPPVSLSREEWEQLRHRQDPNDPLTAFAGIGCSVHGAWFRGYAARYKYTKRWVTSATAAANSLTKKLSRCANVTFNAHDYHDAPSGGLTYLDPPYAGMMGYPAAPPWQPREFWSWALERTKKGLVAVSEMSAPEGWSPLLTFDLQHRIATGSGKTRREYLYVHNSQRDAWTHDKGHPSSPRCPRRDPA